MISLKLGLKDLLGLGPADFLKVASSIWKLPKPTYLTTFSLGKFSSTSKEKLTYPLF